MTHTPRTEQELIIVKNLNRIVQRCYNPNHHKYYRYGGRGITLYPEWRETPGAFVAWVLEHLGERPPGMTLDRIENEGNYEPGNLRWATNRQQLMNRTLRPGQSGYRWVHPHNGKYRGMFFYYKRQYRTTVYPTPIEAYHEVMALRLEVIGIGG